MCAGCMQATELLSQLPPDMQIENVVAQVGAGAGAGAPAGQLAGLGRLRT